jgi:transmembrane sensor
MRSTPALTAWRQGKLVFDNAPSPKWWPKCRATVPAIAGRPGKVARLRLSSTFSIDDTDALLRALPSILPVAIKAHEDGSSEIIAK